MGLTSWDIYNSVVSSEAGFNYGDHLVYYVSPRNLDGIVFGPGEDTGFGIAAKNPDDVRRAWCTVTVGSATIKADLVYGDDGCWHLYVDVSWSEGGDCNVGAFVYQDASGNETEIDITGFLARSDFSMSTTATAPARLLVRWAARPTSSFRPRSAASRSQLSVTRRFTARPGSRR